ncbi:MAG: type II secretion system F family protein [Planctomycetes bacterium]|nr:type II secretion system F family protein [Planctomycetota bacterium]
MSAAIVFSRQIPLKSLSIICRNLGTMLASGVELRKSLSLAAGKAMNPRAREALDGVSAAVSEGDQVAEGMRRQDEAFPELMIDMVGVGEETGSLPEILRSLAAHYENLLRLRKHLVGSLIWPTFQYVAAVLVIALLITILGWIAETRGGEAWDVTGLGLVGGRGAIIWILLNVGLVAAVVAGYKFVRRSLKWKQVIDPVLMQVPVVGRCMRSFAIARFSWAFALTQQSGMSIGPSLQASLRATSNGAFLAAAPGLWRTVRDGGSLSQAFSASRLFPPDFVEMVAVAEASGTVPEMLDRLSPQFEEDARRDLKGLTTALGWAVWAIVAMFVIFLIFSIFTQYIGMLNTLSR